MNQDGTGAFANGNIVWDVQGNTTFKGKIIATSGQIGGIAIYSDHIGVTSSATGEPGVYERIEEEELLKIRAYFQQIAFAGTHALVVSRKGDVLVPRVTVYHDGAVSEDEVYTNIENSLNGFIANVSFDGVVYAQKIIDAIQKSEHVVDVHIDTTASDLQGIFVAQYDDDNNLIPVSVGDDGEVITYEQRVGRYFTPNSGFLKQSSRSGAEADILTWREAITLRIEQ